MNKWKDTFVTQTKSAALLDATRADCSYINIPQCKVAKTGGVCRLWWRHNPNPNPNWWYFSRGDADTGYYGYRESRYGVMWRVLLFFVRRSCSTVLAQTCCSASCHLLVGFSHCRQENTSKRMEGEFWRFQSTSRKQLLVVVFTQTARLLVTSHVFIRWNWCDEILICCCLLTEVNPASILSHGGVSDGEGGQYLIGWWDAQQEVYK